MPNHQKSIEDADLWDILDWDHTAKLSEGAVGIPKDNPVAWTAKRLIDAGAGKDVEFFHAVCGRWIGHAGSAAERRQKAAALAETFGAEPARLIEFVAFKWGLFKRKDRAAK
jgi:hypothetical protein